MNENIEQALKLKKEGVSNRQIAVQLGCSHTLINLWIKNQTISIKEKPITKTKTFTSNKLKTHKREVETLENPMETRPNKPKIIAKGIKVYPNPTMFSKTVETVEIKHETPPSPVQDKEDDWELALENYYFSNYCKEMNSKLYYVLNGLLSFNGKNIAKKRVEELLEEVTKDTFEKNSNYRSTADYLYNDFFKQIIIQIKSVLKQSSQAYQIRIIYSEEKINKMKEILYILENENIGKY